MKMRLYGFFKAQTKCLIRLKLSLIISFGAWMRGKCNIWCLLQCSQGLNHVSVLKDTTEAAIFVDSAVVKYIF